MLPAGVLKHRVTFRRIPVTRVKSAEVKGEPNDYAVRVPAQVTFLSGGELYRAQQNNSSVNVRIVLRYRTDVLPTDQVVYGSRVMEIKAVIPDEDRREKLTLECVSNG